MRTSEALHLGDLQGVFIIYGFFIVASVVTFLFEGCVGGQGNI